MRNKCLTVWLTERGWWILTPSHRKSKVIWGVLGNSVKTVSALANSHRLSAFSFPPTIFFFFSSLQALPERYFCFCVKDSLMHKLHVGPSGVLCFVFYFIFYRYQNLRWKETFPICRCKILRCRSFDDLHLIWKLAYPSEVYCNLSLMIGSPVIDGGMRELPAARQPSAPSLLPSGGEAASIFEMCFDHRSSQKALILYWPKMKGIRCKNPLWKAISIYRWCFVCLFSLSLSLSLTRSLHPLKRGHLDIIKRSIPKRKAVGFDAFQMFCWEKQGGGTARLRSEHSWIPVISLPPLAPYPSLSAKKPAFTTKQIQTVDNE